MSPTGFIWVGSFSFVVVWIILAICLSIYTSKQTKDKSLACEYVTMSITLSFLGIFCMWLMWICVYLHQLYPLIYPTVKFIAD
jgi:V-type H+-transporting ATPase subunit e